jgi:hypothetical protein
MTTGYDLTSQIIRLRNRPKPTATNAKITRAPFGDMPKKSLPIPLFINDYNHYMGAVDRANQLRSYFTAHFRRNEKEFFPGLIWCLDMVVTNCYKIHCHINKPIDPKTGRPKSTAHRNFVENLVNLLFLQQYKGFAESIITEPYPKYVHKQAEPGQKILVPQTISTIINHTQIKRDKVDYCRICREKIIKQKRTVLNRQPKQVKHPISFKLTGSGLVEYNPKYQREKRDRGRLTRWYCQDCEFPICKEGQCWQEAHSLINN